MEVDFVVRETPDTGLAFEIKWLESKADERKYGIFTKANPECHLRFLGSERFWEP